MKHVILIGGTMGVGKTTICQALKKKLACSVFLDGDWCWDASPFQVTDETQKMVLDNITHLLNNFIHCSVYDYVIFGWVMHQQDIIDEIISRLDTSSCQISTISLTVSPECLKDRLMKDVDCGIRTIDVVERSLQRIDMYRDLNTYHIDTSYKTIDHITQEIISYIHTHNEK